MVRKKKKAISAKTVLETPLLVKSEAITAGALHLVPGTVFETDTVISWKEFEAVLFLYYSIFY